MNNDSDYEKLRLGILNHGIFFGDPSVNAGYIWDLRELLLQDNYALIAGSLLWKKIKKYQPEVLYGDGYGAAPVMFAIQHAALLDGHNLSLLWVREQRKDRNRKRLVEGPRVKVNSRAVFVDDIFSYGTTWSKIHSKLKEENIQIITVALASILDLWRNGGLGGTRRIFSQGYPIETLFRRHDLGLTRIDAKKLVVKKPKWRFITKNLGNPKGVQTRLKCPPKIYRDRVFHCTDQGTLYCLDLETGNIIWNYEPVTPYHKEKEVINEFQIFENKLYYASYDGICRCFNIDTGQIIWQRLTATYQHSTPEIDRNSRRLLLNAELVMKEFDQTTQQIIYKNNKSDISCYDIDTGNLIWRSELISGTGPGSATIIDDFSFIIASNNNSLRCHRLSDGSMLWSVPFPDHIKGKSVIFREKIYAVDESGWLKIINFNGSVLKTVRIGIKSRHQFLTVVDSLGYIIVTAGSHIHCFDEFGTRLWISKSRDTIETRGSLQGFYYLTVGKEKGYIQVNDVRDGSKVLGQHTSLGQVLSPPSWENNVLAVHTQNKGLFIFETNQILEKVEDNSEIIIEEIKNNDYQIHY